MSWQPRGLKLTKLQPAQAKVGHTCKVTVRGEAFGRGIQLILVHQNPGGTLRPDQILPCNSVQITQGKYELSFELSLDCAAPGTYSAIVWNLPLRQGDASERYVLENAFTVTV